MKPFGSSITLLEAIHDNAVNGRLFTGSLFLNAKKKKNARETSEREARGGGAGGRAKRARKETVG